MRMAVCMMMLMSIATTASTACWAHPTRTSIGRRARRAMVAVVGLLEPQRGGLVGSMVAAVGRGARLGQSSHPGHGTSTASNISSTNNWRCGGCCSRCGRCLMVSTEMVGETRRIESIVRGRRRAITISRIMALGRILRQKRGREVGIHCRLGYMMEALS